MSGASVVHRKLWVMAALMPRVTTCLSGSGAPINGAYAANYGSELRVDQAAWASPLFWQQVDEALPGLQDSPSLARFRGFCNNLRSETPGATSVLPTGQEVLRQYCFPGLQEDHVERVAYPSLEQLGWDASLRALAPVARDELSAVLDEHPLLDDNAPPPMTEAEEDEEAATAWNRAAWFGWQFMSLRDAKRSMPGTLRALRDGGLPAAHRFIGIARQRGQCEGTLHSDRRNYLLSTLTPLVVPASGACGVVVPGHGGEKELVEGEPICLDNTFKHFVFNRASTDRFVLMIECWHPELTADERHAMATLFAVKDRFTLLSLKQCPWGFGDQELERAIRSKEFRELEFWRDLAYGL